MSSNNDDHAQEDTPWQPSWRSPRGAVDPTFTAEVCDALRAVDRLRHIQDLCRLVDFSFRLPVNRGHELFDPAAAVDRLERYRSDPTPESAAAAKDAIVQYVRGLPTERDAVLAWEAVFSQRRMEEFLPDPLPRA